MAGGGTALQRFSSVPEPDATDRVGSDAVAAAKEKSRLLVSHRGSVLPRIGLVMPLPPPDPFLARPPGGKFERVRAVVRRIPRGRVSTYGRIARAVTAAGYPLSARAAGWALRNSPEDVPWHRVVNAAGELSAERRGSCPPGLQRAMLEAEDVPFDDRGRVRLRGALHEPSPADAFLFPDGMTGAPTASGR